MQIGDVITFANHEWFVIGISDKTVKLLAKNADFWEDNFAAQVNDYRDSGIRHRLNDSRFLRRLRGVWIDPTELEDIGISDKVFLLSKEEAEDLPLEIRDIGVTWWLRSPGMFNHLACCVLPGGYVNSVGDHVYYDVIAVRPAIQVRTSAL